MLYRLGKHVRPLVFKLNQRSMSSKRNFPISTSGNTQSPRFGIWWDAKDIDRHFEKVWRYVDRMVGPGVLDANFVRHHDAEVRSEVTKLKYDREGFELRLDVQQFSPSELDLKLTGNILTVNGKHEQKSDEHGHICREFHRELTIPEDVDLETMTSTISEDGILTISAAVKETVKTAKNVIKIRKEPQSAEMEHNTD